MKKLALLLNIQPDEGLLTLLMLVYSFLIAASRVALEITANSLFVAEFGAAAIPYIFIATALIAPFWGLLFSRRKARLPPCARSYA